MTWPQYSEACREDVNELLRRGGSLSAFRANKDYGAEPFPGTWAAKLEGALRDKFRVKHAVACNSGTAGLHMACHGLDLKGKEVVTSPYTFSATAAAILQAGGVPRFCDVSPTTFSIEPEGVKRVITRKTAAILPVHLFGKVGDCGGLGRFGLPVVEDACQAVGGWLQGGYSGTLSLAGAYSFNGGKNIPAGEAGCLVTNSSKVAEKARLLMNHGENFNSPQIGYNYRINEVTACIAWHGLKELDWRNKRRRELASVLNETRYAHPNWTRTFDDPPGSHVYYVYPFTIHKVSRRTFIKRMADRGIEVGAGYITPPLHKYPAFKKWYRPLPVVEELSSKSLCLLSCLTPDKDIDYAHHVAKSIVECL